VYIIFIFIIFGALALGIGAEMIVRSSINLANIYKVSGYFIGFTIVALGTSLPELASTIQALRVVESLGIAFGNIIGSNIANILLILGVISIICPIIFPERSEQKNQTLVVLFITLISAFIFYYISSNNIVNSVPFGILLILLLIGFLLWQYKVESQELTEINSSYNYSQILSYVILFFGLIFLYFGSKYFIIGSKMMAEHFKISEAIIGLTLVAFGTSLPELATGVAAAIRKQTNLALGTILGSNIYNIVGIFAIILFLKPANLNLTSETLILNFVIMILVTFIFVYKVRFGLKIINLEPFRLGRNSGIIFLTLYAIYIFYNFVNI
tara:strand:+ start:14551 stop:15531 length:981 start_codon:yes stop_codon:yes gene_type:complete